MEYKKIINLLDNTSNQTSYVIIAICKYLLQEL